MNEGRIMLRSKKPVTIDTIYGGLEELGVNLGDILLVHSSLSSLGWVCGGAQTLIMGLTKVLGDRGTLVMPAHSGNWTDPKEWKNPSVPKEWIEMIYENMPAFDPDITPTWRIGRTSELFRTLPGTLRSNHPQVSFAAKGKFAEEIVRIHPLTPQFGMDSPLGKQNPL